MKQYKLKELKTNTTLKVSQDVIDFLDIHNIEYVGDDKIYLINNQRYKLIKNITRRERKLKGYRNRRMNFLSNRYIMGIDPIEIKSTPNITFGSEITITNMTGHDIIIHHLGSQINLGKDEKINL